MIRISFFLALFCSFSSFATSSPPVDKIKDLIQQYRSEVRGPYRDIKWFCKDGSVIDSKAKCPDGGQQHARLKPEVESLAKDHNIFLTQILTGTEHEDFWDKENRHSRLIQYMIEQYLFDIDNGWINEKGQYYRGAKQIEDEMEWGRDFFTKILENKQVLNENYLLLRRALRVIPHGFDDKTTQNIRSISLEIADKDTKFQNIRIKIHGKPGPEDIELVKKYMDENSLKAGTEEKFKMLLDNMETYYLSADTSLFREWLKVIPAINPLDAEIKSFINEYKNGANSRQLLVKAVDLSILIRQEIFNIPKAKTRLALLNMSNKLEDIIIIEGQKWQSDNIDEALEKLCLLNAANLGGGYINEWEWNQIVEDHHPSEITLGRLQALINVYRRSIQWGTGMIYASFKDDVNSFTQFEPLSAGFNDNVIRSSPLLPMGNTLDQLYSFFTEKIKLKNKVFDLRESSQIIGINAGISKGVLEVVDNFEDDPLLDPNKIYIFNTPPRELKPIAGIATVTEGNVVSHVQLLARNLGIPNAAISLPVLQKLKEYSGKEIFFAVNEYGSVVMKLTSDMTNSEKALFKEENKKRNKITISLDKLHLEETNVLNIRDIDAQASGVICGPKAANFAQLKQIFPENVVEGLVIPFGIFKAHMDQRLPGSENSYWTEIQNTLTFLKKLEEEGLSIDSLDHIQNETLSQLRNKIVQMPLLPEFEKSFVSKFEDIMGGPLGTVPVFLRSDTNMEDLKEFTGAGLNLTLFNVVEKEKILKGIREVWASPFSERSYKWRQRYLDNPENVYPSILVIPSVDVDKSGVLITKGILTGDSDDLTIAFSKGVGGAVDGQAAETYLAHHKGGYIMTSPSRETFYRTIPTAGGSLKTNKYPMNNILNSADLQSIWQVAKKIKNSMPQHNMEGPYDVELGIKDDKIWLFQVRPFVENKNSGTQAYLDSLTPTFDFKRKISISEKI